MSKDTEKVSCDLLLSDKAFFSDLCATGSCALYGAFTLIYVCFILLKGSLTSLDIGSVACGLGAGLSFELSEVTKLSADLALDWFRSDSWPDFTVSKLDAYLSVCMLLVPSKPA